MLNVHSRTALEKSGEMVALSLFFPHADTNNQTHVAGRVGTNHFQRPTSHPKPNFYFSSLALNDGEISLEEISFVISTTTTPGKKREDRNSLPRS